MEEEFYTAEEFAALLKEISADREVAKREDAHWYGEEAFAKFLDARRKAPVNDKAKGKGIER